MSEKLTILLTGRRPIWHNEYEFQRIAPGYFACGDMPMDGLYMASTRRTSKMVRPPSRAGRRRYSTSLCPAVSGGSTGTSAGASRNVISAAPSLVIRPMCRSPCTHELGNLAYSSARLASICKLRLVRREVLDGAEHVGVLLVCQPRPRPPRAGATSQHGSPACRPRRTLQGLRDDALRSGSITSMRGRSSIHRRWEKHSRGEIVMLINPLPSPARSSHTPPQRP